jgi:hypothetical protein
VGAPEPAWIRFSNRILRDSNGLRYTRLPRCIIRASTKKNIGRELVLYFTAVEMDDDPDSYPPPTDTSMAERLAFWISDAAADHDIIHKAENALACVDSHHGGCRLRHGQPDGTLELKL